MRKTSRAGGEDQLGVELERVPTSAFKSALDIWDWSTTFACVHPLPWRLDNDSQHFFGDLTLQAPHAARLRFFFFFFFFFFLPSIAQRIGFKPPPSHMKVLSFVRDVWNFEMTPKCWACVHFHLQLTSIHLRMYPNRLRSGTLNLVRFRSSAVVQCEHNFVFRRFLHSMCRTRLLCAIRLLPWTGARNVSLLAACMALHIAAETILRAMTSATKTEALLRGCRWGSPRQCARLRHRRRSSTRSGCELVHRGRDRRLPKLHRITRGCLRRRSQLNGFGKIEVLLRKQFFDNVSVAQPTHQPVTQTVLKVRPEVAIWRANRRSSATYVAIDSPGSWYLLWKRYLSAITRGLGKKWAERASINSV